MDLTAAWRAFRRDWYWVLLILAVAIGAGWVVTSVMPKSYTVESQLLYGTTASGSVQDQLQATNLAAQRAAVDAQLVLTPTILTPVIESLGLDETPLSLAKQMESLAQATFLAITVTNSDPEVATLLSQEIVTQLATRAQSTQFIVNPLDPESPTYSFTVTTVLPPQLPDEPSSPSVLINTLVAVMAGIVFAAIFLAIRAGRDTRIHGADELRRVYRQAPVGAVPPPHPSNPIAALRRASRQRGIGPEYAILRTALSANRDSGALTVVVADTSGRSAVPVAFRLAAAFAATGRDTLLVETDARRPVVAEALELPMPGLYDVLTGAKTLDAVARATGVENLTVISAGPGRDDSSELLARAIRDGSLSILENFGGVVVMAAAPAATLADASILARKASHTVLLVRPGSTTRGALERAVQGFAAAKADVPHVAWLSDGEPTR